ncbi:MAG: hypothetical protein LBJ16_01540 [Holosporaceae bacterium]|jgi:hypothetical protein|nr:hypothetical protein [Holosporaceae bacterium]
MRSFGNFCVEGSRIFAGLLVLYSLPAFGNQEGGDDGVKELPKCTLSNDVNVVLHEDFKMNCLLIGVVLHVGNQDVPPNKFGIIDIIAHNIIPAKMHDALRRLGITYEVCTGDFCVQILANINPKRTKDFLDIIYSCLVGISVENLESYRKYAATLQQLMTCVAANALDYNIVAGVKFANRYPRSFFSEKYMDAISAQEVENFYRTHFQACPISIIACGAIGFKGLIKMLRGSSFSKLSKRRKYVVPDLQKLGSYRDITLENKHMRNGIIYGYLLDAEENKQFGNVFNKLLAHEMFKHFKKTYPLIMGYEVTDAGISNGRLKLVKLYPRSDVPLASLENAYRLFEKKACSVEYAPEFFSKIAYEQSVTRRIFLTNLQEAYAAILKACLRGENIANSEATKNSQANPTEIKKFLGKVFNKEKIFKITTKFKADN